MKPKQILQIGLVALFVTALGLGTFLATRQGPQYQLSRKAAGPAGTATLTFQTDSTTRYTGDTFPVKILVDTAGTPISGAAFGLHYASTGNPADLQVIDADPNAAGVQITPHLNNLDSSFSNPVNLVTTSSNGEVFIDFSVTSTSPDGWVSPGPVLLATIMLKANTATSKTIEHDPLKAIITRKSDGSDILQTVQPLNLNLLADTQAPTVTISAGPDEGSTATRSAVTLTWTATDNPVRAADTVAQAGDILYRSKFDNQNFSSFGPSTSVTQTLSHGPHTFTLQAKDSAGNESTAVTRSFTVSLIPNIASISPTHGPTDTLITLTGSSFGTTKAGIKFGTATVPNNKIVSWTDTQIQVKVPPAANGGIKVILSSPTRESNTVDFTLDTLLNLTFNFQAITQDRGPQTINLLITKGNESYQLNNQTVEWNNTATAYTATLILPNNFLGGSSYRVSLKGDSWLRRAFPNLTLNRGASNVFVKKAATDTVKLGDVNNDNKLNIQDFGLMMAQVTGLTVPVTAANAKFDFNRDAIINVADVGLLLANYTALEIIGDPE